MKKALRIAVLSTMVAASSAPLFAAAPTGGDPRPPSSNLVSEMVAIALSILGL